MRIRAALAIAALFLSVLTGCSRTDTGVRSSLPEHDASSSMSDAGLMDDAQDAAPSPRDGGENPNANEPLDDGAANDGGDPYPPDAAQALDPGCGEASSLDVLGDYWHTAGEEHWLRKNATSVTYSIVPNGGAHTGSPPQLYRVVRACNDGRFFVATNAEQTVVRVDFEHAEAANSLRLCIRSAEFGSVDAAIQAKPIAFEPGNACSGAPWRLLVRQGL